MSTSENTESRILLDSALLASKKLNIEKILAYAEEKKDQEHILKSFPARKVIWLTAEENPDPSLTPVIQLPDPRISRTDQVMFGLLFAVLNGLVGLDETVLCLTGLAGSKRLDNMLITNLRRDNPWFRRRKFDKVPKEIIESRTFLQTLKIAVKFAKEGREGKSIGTAFLIGQPLKLKRYLKQLILNPLAGHKKADRNIHNPEFIETLRELTSLDGAFLVSPTGVIESAAAYIQAPQKKKKVQIPKGLGARHSSAALLSAATQAITIVISESSSAVAVFYKGSAILTLED